MDGKQNDEVRLKAPARAPVPFELRIAPTNGGHVFDVAGPDPASGGTASHRHELSGREQNDYLALFEGISRTFGTRLPRNRQESEPSTFTAPYRVLLDRNIAPEIWYGYGDPAVTRVPAERTGDGDWYYLFATSNDAPNSFPILRSRTLDTWELTGFVFPEGRKPAWAMDGVNVSDYWAPEMHMTEESFLVCFTAREKSGALAIGLARSSSPEGPFESDEAPIIGGGVIDPHLFVGRDGRSFLFWKEDSNDVWPSLLSAFLHDHPDRTGTLFPLSEDQRTASLALTLWPWVKTLEPMERFLVQQVLIEAVVADFAGFRERLQALLGGGMPEAAQAGIRGILTALRTPVYAQEFDPRTRKLLGERRIVLENDQVWEAHLIEGIWVLEHAGLFYMFYAGNDFSTPEYGTGVAVAPSPLGPYRKMDRPLLRSSAEWVGPGHPSVAPGPDGAPWLFLHAFFPGEAGYKKFRALLAVPLHFDRESVTVQPASS
ncbi:family 43 glycosylhydrolase [Microvirga aerilata]|uniref:Family 43 glycosylhydrolase n=1 Tax=Microvirga aerilata TaxID=670292 RepID=A0A936ZGB1_9HYPH|nr:family 43 glycosylhydrolase [Microvirga aerilata]MBL0405320.1 family 43 glycosylhydrolase [Microvirga aerilata]